jgi:hypothetical protein
LERLLSEIRATRTASNQSIGVKLVADLVRRMMKGCGRSLVHRLTILSLIATLVVIVLWAHSMSILDRIEWRNSSDFIERINAVESVGGRIVLSHITIRHLNEISAPIGSAIIHQTRKLGAAETAFKTASDDRILASQGWSRWGFGAAKMSFQQSSAATWQHLPSNDILETRYVEFQTPYWFILLLMLILPAMWIGNSLGARRSPFQSGHCQACGYDLRATPDCCPECGTIPPKKEMIST